MPVAQLESLQIEHVYFRGREYISKQRGLAGLIGKAIAGRG
jgi:hypothetical protein